MRYFATVPVSSSDPSDLVGSIFISPFEEMLPVSGVWNEPGKVIVVIHPPGPRVEDWQQSKEPESEHGIALLDEQDDVQEGPDGWIVGREGQKFGGRPTFLQRERLQDVWNDLEQSGFSQLVQFGWPEPEPGVTVQGSWPFGGGAFSLALRGSAVDPEWRWCWQIG